MYYLLLPTLAPRQALIAYLKARGSSASSIICRCTLGYGEARRQGGRLPRHRGSRDRLLRLPFYNELTEAEQARIVETNLGIDGIS